ncbi:hypothetical protein ACWCQP_37370 [Streptomyces chartreusis]
MTYAESDGEMALMTRPAIRMTLPTVEVLRLLLQSPADDPLWAAKIAEVADLGKSTVSQILAKLVELTWVVTSQEEEGSHPGRPPHTFYLLTDPGRQEANLALAVRDMKLQVQRGGTGKTSMTFPRPGFSLAELLAQPEVRDALEGYGTPLIDVPGPRESLPASASEQFRAIDPGPPQLKLPRPNPSLAREMPTTSEDDLVPEAKTVLPDREEFTRRLSAVYDTPHVVAELYPKLVSKAGTRVTGTSFVLALHLAIRDYGKGMPPMVAGTLLRSLDSFVRAVIDDPAVQRDALNAVALLQQQPD